MKTIKFDLSKTQETRILKFTVIDVGIGLPTYEESEKISERYLEGMGEKAIGYIEVTVDTIGEEGYPIECSVSWRAVRETVERALNEFHCVAQ